MMMPFSAWTILLIVCCWCCCCCRSSNAYSSDSSASQKLLQICLSGASDIITIGRLQELFLEDKLDKTIDINTRDPVSGQTCLMGAVLRGKAQTVELLLYQGADASIAEKDGYTPPHGAAFQGRTDVMAVLHEYGISSQDYHLDGYLPFHRACWGQTERHAAFVNYLLSKGIVQDANVPSQNGKTCREMTSNPHILQILDQWDKNMVNEGRDEL